MATEQTPQTVTQHTPQPTGNFPPKVGMGIVLVLVIVLIGLSLFSGTQEPDPAASAIVSAPRDEAPPNPAELREFQDKLRAWPPVPASETGVPVVGETPLAGSAQSRRSTGGEPESVYREEPARVDSSLSAPLLVATRRPARWLQPAAARSSSQAAVGAELPSVDETAQAVLRAMNGGGEGVALPQALIAAPSPVQRPAESAQGPIQRKAGTHRLVEGTVIDGILMNRLDGSSASPVRVLVTSPVYSDDLTTVLVPKGSTALGRTSATEDFGASRLAVSFHRLLLPNGQSVSLDAFKGLNQAGDAGVKDTVNHHWWSTFGASAAIGLIGGLTNAISTGFQDNHGTTVILGSGVDGTSQAAAEVMSRFLNRPPEITIREGHRVKIYVAADLDVPAYRSGTN